MALATSCLNNDDPYSAGFVFSKPTTVGTGIYANTQVDSISFFSYGSWSISGSDSWCKVNVTSGRAGFYAFPVLFETNTSGKGRQNIFTLSDTDHPGEASAQFFYWQYATRGDGTLGTAKDVKTITGSDGSHFEMEYDDQHRPLSLRVSKDGSTLQSITIKYDDTDSIITVSDMSKVLTASYGRDFQPNTLTGNGDTIGYRSQYYSNGYTMPASQAFNLEHRTVMGNNAYYAVLLGGQSLLPDSLHNADSLRIARTESLYDTNPMVKKYKLVYSTADNRCQSVDVNQLVFGAEYCDPYQLLSLFRYTRSTSIVSRLSGDAETIEVAAELNSDRSVNKLVVTAGGETVTYTFEY